MRVRAAASAVLAGLVAAMIAGCGFVTPIATQFEYAPSDGVAGSVGEVEILNAFVLTEDGVDGNLLFVADNDSDETVELGLQYVAGGEKVNLTVELPPNSMTPFGFGENGQLLLAGLGAAAGSLAPVYFQYGDHPGVQLQVPVLDGDFEQYEPYLPTPTPTPTPEPTGTETPEPTETPAP